MSKTLMVVVVALVVALSGCASTGSSYNGRYSQTHYARSHGVLGTKSADTGALVGGVAGAAVSEVLGLRGATQALVVVGGMVLGNEVGHERDVQDAAIGGTDCRWRYAGTVDANGKPQQKSGHYECSGGNSTVGNRNYPPVALPQ